MVAFAEEMLVGCPDQPISDRFPRNVAVRLSEASTLPTTPLYAFTVPDLPVTLWSAWALRVPRLIRAQRDVAVQPLCQC